MNFHLLRPYWLLALIPVLFLCWKLTKVSLANNWRGVCDEHLLPHLLVLPKNPIKNQIIWLILGWIVAVFALCGPSFEKQAQPIYRSTAGRIFVLNLSSSMMDPLGSSKKIDRARFKLLDYLNRQKEGVTGLVVYTDEAHTISPLTEDNHTIANFIPVLEPSIMPTSEDDTVVGLREAEKLFKQSGLSQGAVVLVADKLTHFSAAKAVAHDLLRQGYHLYILDISDNQNINSQMQVLAEAGGGKVITLTPNNKDVDTLLSSTTLDKFLPSAIKKTEGKGFLWQDQGRWFVFLLLPLALAAFRRGYL